MSDIFLPGPFAERDLLGAIVGGEVVAATPATLRGHALRADPQGARVALVAAADEATLGGVARVGPEVAARLGYALAAMAGAAATAAHVMTTTGPATAVVSAARQAPRQAWPATPEPEWRAHLAEVAGEAMSQFGRRPAGEMARLLPGLSYRAIARVRGRAEAAPVRRRWGYAAAVDVEPLAVERPYVRYFSIEEHRLRHRRFDGRMSGAIDRAVFASGDAVTVLPFDPNGRRVLLIEQFRAGPFARHDPHPWCLETVAGRCDPGEGPEATARREAREEAGLELGRIERIAGYYTSPGTMAEHITAFVAEADLAGAGGVFGLAEEDEDIRVLVVPLDEALDLAAAGEINNAPLLVSLLWLQAQAERLTAVWGDG